MRERIIRRRKPAEGNGQSGQGRTEASRIQGAEGPSKDAEQKPGTTGGVVFSPLEAGRIITDAQRGLGISKPYARPGR